MSQLHTVCQMADIPEGQARMFVVDDIMIGVFNVGGEFFALRNECPHAGASLAHGIMEGDMVSCRIHHWRFRIQDGTYLDEDNPQCNAQSFPVHIVGDKVQVELPSADS